MLTRQQQKSPEQLFMDDYGTDKEEEGVKAVKKTELTLEDARMGFSLGRQPFLGR